MVTTPFTAAGEVVNAAVCAPAMDASNKTRIERIAFLIIVYLAIKYIAFK
jgi:hypothetical protein